MREGFEIPHNVPSGDKRGAMMEMGSIGGQVLEEELLPRQQGLITAYKERLGFLRSKVAVNQIDGILTGPKPMNLGRQFGGVPPQPPGPIMDFLLSFQAQPARGHKYELIRVRKSVFSQGDCIGDLGGEEFFGVFALNEPDFSLFRIGADVNSPLSGTREKTGGSHDSTGCGLPTTKDGDCGVQI